MFDGDNTGPAQRRKSLLSFGRDTADRAGSIAENGNAWTAGSASFEDAAARHRRARSRREARPSPILDALAASRAAGREEDESADTLRAGSAAGRAAAGDRAPEEGMRSRLKRLALGLIQTGRDDVRRPNDDRHASGTTVEIDNVVVEMPAMSREAGNSPRAAGNEFWTPLIDPMKVIGAVVDSKRLILAATVLGALVGVAIALSTPKKYEAFTELLVDPRELKLSNLDLTEPGLPSDATLAIVENQVRVLTSGAVLGKVVDKLNLAADPEFNGSRRSFSLRALIGELRGLLSREDEGAASDRRHTLAIENLASNLTVERGGKTFVVTIGVQTESADKSALIANTMADVFLQTYGQLQAQTAGRAADELSARLDELRREVETAERAVADFKAENEIIDPQGRLITDDELVKLNDQLTVARARTLELNAKAASLRDVNVDNIVSGAIPETVSSGVITELRSQYAALKTEADRMAARLGPRHPERLAAEAQLASAREQIAAELRRIAASIQIELKRAVELQQQLAQRLAQLKVRHGDVGGDLVRLRELEREVATKRAVYESYLLRAKQTGEQRDINTANITVISKAYPPLQPTGTSRAMISLAGMFLGFVSGVGLAAMRGAYEALRDRRREQPLVRGGNGAPTTGPFVPPPANPSGGGGPARDLFARDGSGSRRQGGERGAAPSNSQTRAEDTTTQAPADEENAMPTRDAVPYYPVAQSQQPMPAQSWPAPAAPVPPAFAYPAPEAAYGAYAEPAQPPQYAYPQQVPGYAHAYAPAARFPTQPLPAHMHPAFAAGYAAGPQAAGYWHQAAPTPAAGHPSYAYPIPPQQAAVYPQPLYPYGSPPPGQPPAYGAQSAAMGPNPFPVHRDREAPSGTAAAYEDDATSRAIDEIRASLAEFRDAMRQFTESRQKRRFL